MRIENFGRTQQHETASSSEETDDNLIEIDLEETILLGYAKQDVAAEETKSQEYTLQNKHNEIPNVATSEELCKSISPAVGKEKC